MTGTPLDRKCPTCQAPPGEQCRTPKARKPRPKPHSTRIPFAQANGRRTVISPDLTEYISTALANGVPIKPPPPQQDSPPPPSTAGSPKPTTKTTPTNKSIGSFVTRSPVPVRVGRWNWRT